MKNLFLLVILVSFLGTVRSQTTKGTWVVGLHNFSPVSLSVDGLAYNLFPQTNSLGISFGTSKEKTNGELEDDKENSTVIGLGLNSHYFVADQFAIGLVGNLSTGTTTYKYDGQSDEEKASTTLFLIGPELRYYMDAGEKTKVWMKGGVSLGSISYKYDGESEDPINLSQLGGGAGISIFPTSTVSIDLGLGYNVLTLSRNDGSDEYKSINSGLTFDVGFGIFFGGGKM